MPLFSTDHTRWQAVRLRDPLAHSFFVYAVTTARIYCRPTCPARLARRANVTFFDNAFTAAGAGFRACKRCGPEAGVPSLDYRHREAVERACSVIRQSQGLEKFGSIAKLLGFSSRYFHGVFKRVVGMTPVQYAARYYRGRADEEGEGERLSITTCVPPPPPPPSSSTDGSATAAAAETDSLGALSGDLGAMDGSSFAQMAQDLSGFEPADPAAQVPPAAPLLALPDFGMMNPELSFVAVGQPSLDGTLDLSHYVDLDFAFQAHDTEAYLLQSHLQPPLYWFTA